MQMNKTENQTSLRVDKVTLEKLHSIQDDCIGSPTISSLVKEAVDNFEESLNEGE